MEIGAAAVLERHAEEIDRGWATALTSHPAVALAGRGLATELRSRYVPSLRRLLVAALHGEDRAITAVYRDELRRYGSEVDRDTSSISAADVVRAQGVALTGVLKGAELERVSATVAPLNAVEPDPDGAPTATLLLLGDCLMNELRCFLAEAARRDGTRLDGRHLYFSAALSAAFDPTDALRALAQHAVDLVAFSPFSFDALPGYRNLQLHAGQPGCRDLAVSLVDIVESVVAELRELTPAPIVVHDAGGLPDGASRAKLTSLPPLTRAGELANVILNQELERRLAAWPGVRLLRESVLVDRLGRERMSRPVVDPTLVPDAMFHTSAFGAALADEYWPLVDAWRRLRDVRVIAVDFDDTLWDGIAADGAVSHHIRRQRLLRDLGAAGVLLLGLSRGNPETDLWTSAPLLGETDFVAIERSWMPKAQMLDRALGALGIREEYVVVIDNDPTERGLLSEAFPQAAVLDANAARTWRDLETLRDLGEARVTDDARNRTRYYRTAASRESARPSFQETLGSLELQLGFGRAHEGDLPRVAELFARTNQFNTTGWPLRPDELHSAEREDGDVRIFVAELSDRFGDFGTVAAVTVEGTAPPLVTRFAMSCRAMGYGVEQAILALVVDHVERPVHALLLPTRINEPCHGLYAAGGFTERDDGRWVFDGERIARRPGWIATRAHTRDTPRMAARDSESQ